MSPVDSYKTSKTLLGRNGDFGWTVSIYPMESLD